MIRLSAERRVLLCMGPGGVGKTTVAAAVGLAAARAGQRVVVVTVDPSPRLAQALGRGAGDAAGHLDALVLDTRSVFDDLVRAYARDPAALLAHPLYRATSGQLAGSVEYAATAHVQRLAADPAYDLVVLDTPATAGARSFLDAPARIRELVDNPVARLITGEGRFGRTVLGTLEAMVGRGFFGELGTFLRGFGGVLAELGRRAGDFEGLLHSGAAAAVLTTEPTDYSVRESEAFADDLRARRIGVDGIVLNRVLATAPADPGVERVARAVGGRAVADELARMHAQARLQSERADRILADLRRRHPDLPVIPVPLTDPPPISLEALAAIGERLLGGGGVYRRNDAAAAAR